MIEYSQLKYNLYELLNVPPNALKELIEKKYRKIISKFHPDKKKLSSIEEELYYDITEAYYILINPKKRHEYNLYISYSNINNPLKLTKINYQNEIEKTKQYFPNTKNKAFKQYIKQSETLYKRHGISKYNNGNIKKNLKNISKDRDIDLGIIKENFKSTDDFNKQFVQRKKYGGNYSDKIVKYNGDKLIPFDLNDTKLNNAANLKDFHNMYSGDIITGDKRFSSISHAFLLQPYTEIENTNSLDEDINKYKNFSFNYDY